MNIQALHFDERGLIPAIIQESETGRILLFGYMNTQALELTVQTGHVHLWSAAENRVVCYRRADDRPQKVADVLIECEGDALIVKVTAPSVSPSRERAWRETAPTEQAVSLIGMESLELGILLSEIFQMIEERKRERPENSYTALLLDSGLDTILKKLGEQTIETILAAKSGSAKELSARVSGLLYHTLVLLAERELDLRDILLELKRWGTPTPDMKSVHVR
jgi:phosphoribosyl-ATP pyrophosphohydrolase/phosphoribosyl-AMP cyclohydrolase